MIPDVFIQNSSPQRALYCLNMVLIAVVCDDDIVIDWCETRLFYHLGSDYIQKPPQKNVKLPHKKTTLKKKGRFFSELKVLTSAVRMSYSLSVFNHLHKKLATIIGNWCQRHMVETFHWCPKNTVTWVVRIANVCDDVVISAKSPEICPSLNKLWNPQVGKHLQSLNKK